MRVLGISPLDKDSTVSFLEDGRVLFACGEERLSRVKLQGGFPNQAIELGFSRTGWTPESIDAVAYSFFDAEEESRLIRKSAEEDQRYQSTERLGRSAAAYRHALSSPYSVDNSISIPGLNRVSAEFCPRKPWYKRLAYEFATRSPGSDLRTHRRWFKTWEHEAVSEHKKWNHELLDGLRRYKLENKLVRFHHHDTHAANAFYSSGFDETLVLVLDGYGSGCCGGIYEATAEGLHCLHRYRFPYSLGIFYEQVTSGLGFRPSRHEGKIVGLAAYGRPTLLAPFLLERFETKDGDICIHAAQNGLITRALSQHFAKRDIAAAYQYVLEQVACTSLRYWLERTGKRRVVMSGGVHANVKLNQRVREVPGVEEVFVYPNMGDGGCATGAAMLAFGHDRLPRLAVENVYLGPDYNEDQVREALDEMNLQYERVENIEYRVAEALAENAIVGRFAGRMEYGPRALGNRSILYPARDPEVNQWLNEQLGRTEFMPFAPAVLAEAADELFLNFQGCEKSAKFMTITFDCTEEMKRHSPAAVHVDGTARPQMVSLESNPSFYRILSHYRELTGVPVLINTSFNMHEEPIVCSPQDAVRAFLLGNIDYLAVENFFVPHPTRMANEMSRSRLRSSEVSRAV